MFRTVTVDGSSLIVHTPMWIGILLVLVGIATAVVALLPRWPRVYRLGALLGTIILLYGGWQLLGNVITFEPRGFYVESPLGEEMRIGWLIVSGIDQGGLTGKKDAEPGQLVFLLRSGGEMGVDLSGLSAEDQARVVAYVNTRIKP